MSGRRAGLQAWVATGAMLAIVLAMGSSHAAPVGALTLIDCLSADSFEGCTTKPSLDGAAKTAFSPNGLQLYVPAAGSDTLSIFNRSKTTGLLTRRAQCFALAGANGCTSNAVLDHPFAVAVTPDGENVYVVTNEAPSTPKPDALVAFDRATDGSLEYRQCFNQDGSSGCVLVPGLDGPTAVTARNDSVYVASFASNAVVAFGRSSHNLTFLGCVAEGVQGCASSNERFTNPTDIVISPDGIHAFVSNYNSPYRVVTLDRAGNGLLAARSDVASCVAQPATSSCGSAPALREATSLALSGDGHHLYVTSRYPYGGGEAVELLDVGSTGTLTWRNNACWNSPGETIAGCTGTPGMEGPNDVVLSPSGTRLYVASLDEGGNLVALKRSTDGLLSQLTLPSGCLTAGTVADCGPFSTGAGVLALAVSPDGANLYATPSEVSRLWSFKIKQLDTTPPKTTITKAPPKETTNHRVTFRFKSSEDSSTFRCKFDDGSYSKCTSPKSKTVDRGWHTFKVFAVDRAGNKDPTPAKYSWRVVRN